MRTTLLAVLLLLLTACAPRPAPPASPLRALDPADSPNPASDITAVYLEQTGEGLKIRVDLLDFQKPDDLSLDIRIESDSAPEAEALTLRIPSQTDSARIALDPLLDTVIIDIPNFPKNPRLSVSTPDDEVRGISLDTPTPTQTAPLLLTFYETFAGRFPAEALRSWDGAHSGPRGERHGLKHLLDAVEEHQVPVVLLDLKQAENLSALDAMDALPRIQSMEQTGLLLLPDQPWQEPIFGFSPSPFSWGEAEARPVFILTDDPSHLYSPLFSQTLYIPVTVETDTTQPTPDGPPLAVRRAILEIALNNDKNDLLVLGGSLVNSTWASPDMVGATLAYFASRPYIRVLNADDLMAFPAKTGKPEILALETPPDELAPQAQSALEFARGWAENPPASPIARCDLPDCVLANDRYLAIFDEQSGILTFLFARSESGLHQIVSPSSQVTPGIDQYPGAFADEKAYLFALQGESLVFTADNGSRKKTFTLTTDGLDVFYETRQPVTVQIPLLVDPWTRFAPGWADRYRLENTPAGIRWGLEGGTMVNVLAGDVVTMRVFNESLLLLRNPEDPDFDYPPGHFVPFSMAIVEVEMRDGYSVRVELAKTP